MKLEENWGRLGMKSEFIAKPLSDLADIQTGPFGSQLHKEDYAQTGTPIVTVEHLGKKKFTEQNLPCVSDTDKARLSKYILRKGDIVFSRVGSVDRCSYVSDDYDGWMFSGRCLRVRPLIEIDSQYLYYYFTLESTKKFVRGIATGATMPSINTKFMGEVPITYPPIEVQCKIASILSTLDDKIELNNKINKNLLEQMQALYKAWFVDFEPFGGVRPSNWNDTNIYAIANIIYGAPFASKLFNTDGLGKPIIRIRDLKEQAFVTFTTEEHPKGHLIQPGDIVVGMDGEFRPYIWGNEPAWLNQRVCIFENNRPQGKAFVLYTIKPLLNKIEQTQVATTVIHIGKKDFDAFEIILPDEATLDSFDSITAPMIEQIVNNRLQNKRLAILRDTLLPKLMSGELDVSDIDL